MKLGSLDVSKLYLGSTEVTKAYLGALEVFSGAGWDISTAVFNQSFSVASQDTFPQALFFKPDGAKMYISGNSSDSVHEYDLSPAWDISTAVINQSFDVSGKETSPEGLFFASNGFKMYVLGSVSDSVHEYDLSSAWDISTATFNQSFDVSGQETNASDLHFKPDGTKMYIAGRAGVDINEYDLSSAWNVSTATFNQSFSVSGQETDPRGVFFKPDGKKMYVTGVTGDDVNEYDLSSTWDVSTASYVQNFSVASQDTAPTGIFFNGNGDKMYMLGVTSRSVHEYDLG